MLVVFSPIFVADTKITFIYNFVAPLKASTFTLLNFKNYRKTRTFMFINITLM